jgi:hypothetical protein
MSEWMAAITGLVGVIVGVGISEFRRWQERKEQYMTMTFEKRLEIAQEAVRLCYAILFVLCPFAQHSDKRESVILKNVGELQRFVINNSLYIAPQAQRSIVNFVSFTADYIEKLEKSEITASDDEQIHIITAECEKATKAISNSIGAKYIPDINVKNIY